MKSARKPDVKAPRFRKCAKGTLNAAFIKELREKIPGVNVLSDQQIKDVIHAFNGNLWQAAVDTRDGVELPYQLGHIFIGTCQMKKSKNVDFRSSAEYKLVVQHRNWESDNHLAKIFYSTYPSKYRFKNHEIWAFDPTRAFKRTVGKTYPENWKKYLVIDPMRKINALYRSDNYKMIRSEDAEQNIHTYNEFDL